MFNLSPPRRYTVALALLGFSICLIVIGFGFAPRLQFAATFSAPSTDGGEAPKNSPSPTPTPEIPHTLVGSHYSLENGLEAKLLLNNKGNTQLVVEPTLYNLQGQELQLPPVTVGPQSFRFVDLQDWAAVGGESFRSGNIKLFHYGKDLVLGAQIYLTDESHSLGFEEKLAELGKFDARKQEAVAVIPTQQTRIRVVFTNTADAPLSLTATPARSPNIVGNAHTFQLAAHETRVLDLRQDFVNGNQFADAEVVGLSVVHSGAKDALLARVLLADVTKGYSNVVQFSNPDGGKSSEYQGVGFQIEDIAGLRLAPMIVARNVGNTAATVVTRVPYTRSDGTRSTIVLPQRQLSAGQMGFIDTRNIVSRASQEQISVASLEVEYNSAPGSVIVASHSVSTDGNQVFRVPMWDPLGQRSPTGGYPWRIEGTSVTETYIKNITDIEEKYVAFLLWENGGQYMIGLKTIAPHETVHIDVKKLRDEQIADERGRTIPPYISSGQLQWTLYRKDNLPDDDPRANLALIGRSEQVDLTKGIVNNYSCQNCCAGNHVGGFIFPSSAEIEYGETAHFASVEVQETCYSLPYEFNIGAAWSSSNSAVGTISGGDITPVGVGQTSIGASWSTAFMFSEPCPPGGELRGFDELAAYLAATECRDNERLRGGPRVSESHTSDAAAPLFLEPQCGTCEYFHFTFSPQSATLTVKPRATIESIKAVGKNHTATVRVTVTNNPNAGAITLTLSPSSGTGQAQFTSNNSTTRTITTTTDVEVRGIAESSTKDNIRLAATFNNSSLDTEDFSVVSVILSLRISGSVSADNGAASSQQSGVGTLQLGGPFFSSGTEPPLWRFAIEIVGTIFPANFSEPVILQREVLATNSWNEFNALVSNVGCNPPQPTPCVDTSSPQYRDDDPQSGTSAGKVYDIDSPGSNLMPSAPIGTIRRRRTNFRQWATISQLQGGQTMDVRISSDIEWYHRLSIEKTRTAVEINTDLLNDNQAGPGTTLLSWNFQ